jgi:hypothetical protein
MRFFTCLFSILFLLLCSTIAGAQSDARAELDSNYAETGNPFAVHLRVPQSAGQPLQIDFSPWDSLVPERNILSQSEWLPDGQSFSKNLLFVFFDADTLMLPPLPIRLHGGYTLFTNPLEIRILSTPSPDDLNDMADIKDIVREPAHWTDYLPWAAAIGGLILIVIAGAWLVGRAIQRKKQAAISRSVELPPHDLALKKLDALAQKRWWDNGLVKDYAAELTFIVREYLEKRYQVPALECTSEELLRHLHQTDFPAPLREPLRDLLTHADLVKFARATPSATFRDDGETFARKMILETKPVLTPPVSETADTTIPNQPVHHQS